MDNNPYAYNGDGLYVPPEIKTANEIERLQKRVWLLEGWLRGALEIIDAFVHCDTSQAHAALKEGE